MLTLLVIYGLADDTFAKALIHGEWPAPGAGSAEGDVGEREGGRPTRTQLNVYLFCAI